MLANKRIVILGAGAWGTTLGYLLARAGRQYRIWSRREGISLAEAVAGAEVIVSAVSMKGVKPVISSLAGKIGEGVIIVTATKGLDLDTAKTPSQLWQEAFPCNPIVVLSGPNLSKEIRKGLPAATVVSSRCQKAAELIQTLFASDIFRVYVNDDPLGTELGGTLKNVMAIAAGVCDGLQLGTNAKAALLTRALPEMIRVGTRLGAKLETFFGLSGLGDLLATCDSPLSRNYQVGYQLAQGKSLSDILSNLEGTAEGVNTTEVLVKLAQRENISVPIAYQVYLLLRGELTPPMAVRNLMARELKDEFWFMTGANFPHGSEKAPPTGTDKKGQG
ncbi:MAG: NAD(P)H-dependent glycerol-3-phosphate dehydrogenase [Geminocystis sp.]|nr:NAD(P)H-dependent glycerol-3-phosphate dehydrogenase [Geminocystis sp.]HIK37520.1 NAD(P)H-dependent glycerol-3-phosphate dehydrogenase [Geminocystis sp. M7585_C2015_104]MCS7146674.1 NAD(P)H-dependent glycerol-3-phosphate dehydrogenase [Geminocystis sp.]MCX8077176.1 NAD(P)H-dependent glycerol-3-phosphate dehydrogenase [Geminocystis sp.]MDW8115500.1 NAD(P)H-dependent glycerol-3-phosphate dehydrogenase [Geminocystis sp.]